MRAEELFLTSTHLTLNIDVLRNRQQRFESRTKQQRIVQVLVPVPSMVGRWLKYQTNNHVTTDCSLVLLFLTLLRKPEMLRVGCRLCSCTHSSCLLAFALAVCWLSLSTHTSFLSYIYRGELPSVTGSCYLGHKNFLCRLCIYKNKKMYIFCADIIEWLGRQCW